MIKRIALTLTTMSLALALALGLLAVTPDGAGAAPREPGSSAKAAKICREFASELEEHGLNMGECVNLFAGGTTVNTSRFIVGLCGSPLVRETIARQLGLAPDANKGQCISTIQALFRAES